MKFLGLGGRRGPSRSLRPRRLAPLASAIFTLNYCLPLLVLATTFEDSNRRPNIVVILTDDQGYADIGLNPLHAREVATPHMDALAQDGVAFTQAYTSGHVCSPTRAGLMIGAYSQRVGVYSAGDGGRGFDPQRKIFPAFLPDTYRSAAIGKWHLGLDDDFPELKWHALNRGFDECYKFMGRGAHSYFDLRSDSSARFAHPLYRNKKRINDEGYLTNRLTEEAVAFIDRNKATPFFLYLAYNAVHSPAEAPEADIKAIKAKHPELSNERAILMAMLLHLDNGVGQVVGKLKQEELFDNTLLFFLTDNGGARTMQADNTPLRGFKSSLDEGGIRTPFIVSWPKRFQGGRSVDTPVISFDILPTVLDALNANPNQNHFDGKSLLPLLTERTTKHHETLYWSKGKEGEWAVRRGDWKLHHKRGAVKLVNLAKDPSEKKNLAAREPHRVQELSAAFDRWIAQMASPITGGGKRADTKSKSSSNNKPQTEREKKRARIRAEKRKQREAHRKSNDAAPKHRSDAEPDRSEPSDNRPATVDPSSLTGKVMVGYQGWFNCEGDGAKLGWKHWARNRRQPFAPDNITVDLWPDVSELDPVERYATGFKHADGSTAEVFSSANRQTVLTHFRWMREYGIDGAFLQRFANGLFHPPLLRNNNVVLSHVRAGAKQSGRAFAIMYDLSGLKAGQVQGVRKDWSELRSKFKVTEDANYLHHEGKPLVAIWGVGFSDDRAYSLQECFDLVKQLKADGCSVMLGAPSFWREGKRDAIDDPLLHQAIMAADIVSPWTIGRYRSPNEAARHAETVWTKDLAWCDRIGVDFLPVVFPGFSWCNLQGGKLDQIPRLKGEFFWSQITAAKRSGCRMLYVAMFDEVDEATAIFKCTNTPPTGEGVQLLTYEGLPSDHYLKLAGRAGQLLRNDIPSDKQNSTGKSALRDKAHQPGRREPAADRPRPNVLLIVCDDLNTHVSTSGYQSIKTPAFDQLAAAGMTFHRAYCQYPVCGPSRASFLHGLYPQSTGVLDNKSDIRKVRAGTVSLPQRFKQSGYWTGAVGKVFHNPSIDPGEAAWHQTLRFDNDELPLVTPIRKKFEAENGSIAKGKLRREWRALYPTIAKQTRGQQPGYGPSGLMDKQHKDGKNARQIATWLTEKTHGDKPFFMACGIQKPHVPFLAPDRYFQMYPQADLKFPPASVEFWNQAPKIAQTKRYQGFGFEFGREDDALRREYVQAYHACISFIDAQIGLVLDSLKASGHWDDTIVVLTSDHGFMLGEKFMWGKVMLFENCDRVPLIIRVPGETKNGSRSNGLVELVDLFPTLADLCRITPPAELQGRSLRPMLRNAAHPGRPTAYTVVTRGAGLGKAIRTARWRYAKWPVGEELYDLQNDPLERRNLASSTAHQETLREMRTKLNAHEARANSQNRAADQPTRSSE